MYMYFQNDLRTLSKSHVTSLLPARNLGNLIHFPVAFSYFLQKIMQIEQGKISENVNSNCCIISGFTAALRE